ncbi:ligase-associated DNA damage response DEXH box helicase [Flavihumibacter stibioxidans]|uniref:DNA ligase-associated DEXH box helicase n=1 Tax=Flavihumibacter stibioxidans TaxID=1834163 RepID=A0ABR7M5I7_9BACT|nr:ligase-associated DNA damage response DEXH box helicase [Flavihumibacter stibioxidans]MBC6490232.1 DNA ligase-associated DEXH box helicase [Flavihumibacter stibioxidans]
MKLQQTIGYNVIRQWLTEKGFSPFPFQEETWEAIHSRQSGLVNAPTGYGKTFSVFLGALIRFINENPKDYQRLSKNKLQLLWVTPLRALAKDIGRAMEEVISELGMQWKVGIRNGDTSTAERQKQKAHMPEILIITPESLHLLLAQKGYPEIFQSLQVIAVDEWHELLGSKRGVQVELALSRIISLQQSQSQTTNRERQTISVFAISATIGNLEQAREVLLSPLNKMGRTITAKLPKTTEVYSILPDEIEKYPWAGHLGIRLVDKIVPIIRKSTTTLLFINTRGMSERWYQELLHAAPDLAGAIALHHGSIEQELRIWVEEALHTARLKCVVCTASLDLGVDFRPVETVIQVGSPKGVARFLQRAGRSGHQPGAPSRIYFLPTHSLELVEASALKEAIRQNIIESREPMILCFDVLLQYLCTLAISEGFDPEQIFREVKSTFCFREMTTEEWEQVLQFLTTGGKALQQYDDYHKVEIINNLYRITNRRIAMRHRMHIGTIVSDAMLKVKFISGGYVGVIEEWFISRLEPGESFTLAGRNLELVMIKDMTVLVRKSTAKKSIVPSWQGGRMPLSANLGKLLREQFNAAGSGRTGIPELDVLQPLFELQSELSKVPRADELLIEQIETKDGFHLFVFPFEGRLVHEAMAAILSSRISRRQPITFSFAMNDYGFELLSDQPIPVDDSNVYELFSPENLFADIQRSVNSTEMAKRKFRDIAVIGGLIFQGYPGEHKKARHLQSSASLIFKVFQEYDPDNLLMRQAYREVFDQQMEETRLREMLHRIRQSRIILEFPERLTPFCFPIKVDSMRENLTSEKLEDRIKKMQSQLLK